MKGKRILSTAMAALTLLTAPAALPQQALLLNPLTASAAGKPGSEAEAFAQRNNCQFKAYTNIRFQDQSVDVTLSYQWRYYENGVWRELTWAGSKSATLSIPVDASRENRIYSCWVYTGSGSIALSPHKKVNVKAAFTQQPKSTTQIIGTTAVFTAKASGNAAKTVSGTATLTVK